MLTRYELCLNVDVADGLANGAGGTVEKIQLTSDDSSASGFVWIQFDDPDVGSRLRNQHRALFTTDVRDTCTPIQPIARQFQVGRSHSAQVLRKQFPLRQSSGKTIRRCQGDTLDNVVVDFTTTRKEAHTHYVGMSRVKSLDGLFILNLCADKISVNESVREEMSHLRTDRCMSLGLYLPYLHADTRYHISFLNVRSLHKHIDCVRHDRSLLACDVNLFCETRTSSVDSSDYYHIDTFNSILYHGISTRGHRSHYGLALYSKQPILMSKQPLTLAEDSSHGSAECLFTAVAVHEKLLLKIACIYRPPNSNMSHFATAMSQLVTEMSTIQCDDASVEQHNVILGDFNLDWFDDSTRTSMSQIFPGYRQLITGTSTDYGSTIDHVYTTLPAENIQSFTTESFFSDHKLLILSIM